jgi:FAD/FMN-containing dehydrogenase
MADIVRHLIERIGPAHVSLREDDLLGHSADGFGRWRLNTLARPLAVVFAKTTDDVQKTLALATENETPVVPYCGGTGVSGGATSAKPGIVLDTSGLDRLRHLDVEGLRADVGAGMVLEDLATAVEANGLLFAHDPWSRPVARLGGSIAVNGVGYQAGGYGVMGEQVLGLEVVLPTGEVISTKGVPKVAGPDLAPLFIGSEGVLGVITHATVRLFPLPKQRLLFGVSFPGFESGLEAVIAMARQPLRPAILDFSDEPGEGDKRHAVLYLGFDGLPEEVAVQAAEAKRICQAQGGVLIPQRRVDAFWAKRHESGEWYKREVLGRPPGQQRRRRWGMDYLHLAIPMSKVAEYYHACRRVTEERGITVHEWGLWGRPEYFSLLIADSEPRGNGVSQSLRATSDELLRLGQDMGGSMEYCHGVGMKLPHLMERELGPAMTLLRQVKKAVDPAGIMNPGKMGL